MKKYFGGGIAIAIVAAVVGYNVYASQMHVKLSDIAMSNVEALASGEDGTSVGYCYLMNTYATNMGYKIFCDRQTSESTIYPCPSSQSYDSYSESSKDRCTK